jgi:succinoglycan biosynthesis protein ExoA
MTPSISQLGPPGCSARPTHETPCVSVIVPVRNEAAYIGRTLDALLRQDYPADRFEILVADGRSTDATPAIVREWQRDYPQLRLLDNPRRWSSAGRNRAIRLARGEIIVVIDGHCEVPRNDYLRRLVAAFARSGADCIGRPQPLDIAGATPLQQAIALARSSWLGHHPASHVYSAREQMVRPQSVAVAYRREVFDAIGLFDESFDACEDVEFNHRADRAGLRCFFTPQVAVSYHPRSSLAGLFRQMVRYGRGRLRLLRKHPDTFSLASLAPGVFVLGLVLGAVIAFFSAAFAWVWGAGLLVYGAITAAVSGLLALRRRQPALLFWLPLVFLSIHIGAGTGLLWEWLGRSVRRHGKEL